MAAAPVITGGELETVLAVDPARWDIHKTAGDLLLKLLVLFLVAAGIIGLNVLTALVFAEHPSIIAAHTVQRLPVRPRPSPLPDRVTADELAAHAAFVATLGRAPLWDRWLAADPAKRLASG